ncbi:MAG: hypothetical protein GY862_09370 [Gammaproteobacteria bacterium]|nr:hypothetical protein [Gammaproteobacteria bacterium]
MDIKTLALCHVTACDIPAAAPWLKGASAAGRALPLGLARDLGMLLTLAHEHLRIAKPEHLPFDEDTSAYTAFLERFRAHPLVRELSRRPLPDAVLSVVLARLMEGLKLPLEYCPPVQSGLPGNEPDRVNPAALWREMPAEARIAIRTLLDPQILAGIERNLNALDRDELAFLARFGAPLSGSPDPRELLDLLALMNLPAAVRPALAQTLKLLPKVSDTHSAGGMQTYPEGGYEGLSRKGSLDSLLPAEIAYDEEMFFHRVLNHEALYYGRERARDKRRELAYLVMQTGYGLSGDGGITARALLLALARVMRSRGYEVLYSIAGAELTEPRSPDKPREALRLLYHREAQPTDSGRILACVLKTLRELRSVYRNRQVFWVAGEHFDADDAEEHADLYQALRNEGGQQAWYVRGGIQKGAVVLRRR